jgi:hypothetical protein
MSTTLKLFLLFAITNSFCQNKELVSNIDDNNQNSTSVSTKSEDQKTIKYTYLGLTINPPDLNKIYSIDEIEKKPEFPGNQDALKSYINQNFKTPVGSSGEKVSGTIFASFIIEKDGSISEIGILHDFGYGSGEEAIRLLSQMPKWFAGRNDSKTVRCMYSMPIVCNGE